MEGESVFNPSVIQLNQDLDAEQAREDEEELQRINEGIDRELAALGEVDFGDDDEEESVIEPMNHNPPNFVQQATSTPFTSGFGAQNYENVEAEFLHGPESISHNQLEILYNARGQEILRLKEELKNAKEVDNRQLFHQNALLKSEKERLTVNLEHFQAVAQAQSEENANLRSELENCKLQLQKTEDKNRAFVSQNESTNLMIQGLQTQVMELQKSDTILRAKKQHEETLRSLRDRHENEVFRLEQEIDKLTNTVKKQEHEIDTIRSKLTKSQFDTDRILMEKSEMIKNLQDKLENAQERTLFNQDYSNVKVLHDKYKVDQEKFAAELIQYQEEIDRLKAQLKGKIDTISMKEADLAKLKTANDEVLTEKNAVIHNLQERLTENEKKCNQLMRESLSGISSSAMKRMQEEMERLKSELLDKDKEIVSIKADLEAKSEKYADLKRKVRLYQQHCKNKELRYTEYLKEIEDEFRAKLFALRDKMQDAYSSKLDEIEKEMLDIKRYCHEEVSKAKKFEQIQEPPLKENSEDMLTQLFLSAKMDLKDQLKRPPSEQERQPLLS